MTETEFKQCFYEYWKREYPLVRPSREDPRHPAADIIADVHERVRVYLLLLRFARQTQECGVSRTKKNTAGRLFEALGVDPRSIEFDQKRSL